MDREREGRWEQRKGARELNLGNLGMGACAWIEQLEAEAKSQATSRLAQRLSHDLLGRACVRHASAYIPKCIHGARAYLARTCRCSNMIFLKRSRDSGVELVGDPNFLGVYWREKFKKTRGARVKDT